MMAILYVQDQGTTVRKKDNQLLVTRGQDVLETVPLGKVEQVVVMGRGVQISTALLVDLLQRGVPVVLTNQRGSHHYATLAAGPSRFGGLRTQQMHVVHDPVQALELARHIVQAKLRNQRSLLASTGWASAAAATLQIDAALTSLAAATTIDMVRGYEGAAAAAYFGAWRLALDAVWGFGGRAYYPPPDPVNALLSFGYTLALHDVQTAVQVVGLDPYLGTFHVIEAGRPSLVLDLLEEFRPVIIDRLVLDLIGRGSITRTDFERPVEPPDAVYLNETGRSRFIDAYERVMQGQVRLPTGEQTVLRRVVLLQAQALARVMRGEQERYIGFMP
jgi:CRISPR-associated protein Cas1